MPVHFAKNAMRPSRGPKLQSHSLSIYLRGNARYIGQAIRMYVHAGREIEPIAEREKKSRLVGLLDRAGGTGGAARAELALFELEGQNVDETCRTFAASL